MWTPHRRLCVQCFSPLPTLGCARPKLMVQKRYAVIQFQERESETKVPVLQAVACAWCRCLAPVRPRKVMLCTTAGSVPPKHSSAKCDASQKTRYVSKRERGTMIAVDVMPVVVQHRVWHESRFKRQHSSAAMHRFASKSLDQPCVTKWLGTT